MINKFKNSLYRVSAITVVGSTLIVGSVITNPIYAKQVPITNIKVEEMNTKINYISDLAKELKVIDKVLDKYKTVINKTVAKNGLSITLNEAVLNNDELIVSANIKIDEEIDEDTKEHNDVSFYSKIFINGKQVNNNLHEEDKIINEHNIKTITRYNLNEKYKGDLNIKIVFMNPEIGDNTKKGEWVFEFKTNGDKIVNNTKEILVNHTFCIKNSPEVKINKYVSNDLGQKLYYLNDAEEETDSNYSRIRLEGHDNLGNKVRFLLSDVEDDCGIIMYSNSESNIDANANKLYLTPYAFKYGDNNDVIIDGRKYKKVGNEFIINLPVNKITPNGLK